MKRDVLNILCCSECGKSLQLKENDLFCVICKNSVPVIDSIPRFPGTTQESSREYHDPNIYNPSKWTEWRKKNYAYFKREIGKIDEDALILDIGAGPAPFADLMEAFTVYSVDFVPYKNIDFLADFTKYLPIADDSFDVVVMSNVLEHIPDPLNLLSECKRILKLGGRLILTVPFLIKVHQGPYDFLRYTEFMLGRLFEKGEFDEWRIEKIGNLFDVYEQFTGAVFGSLKKKVASNYIKSKMIGLLYRIYRVMIKILLVIGGKKERFKDDEIGYPQGYSCLALKRN